MVLKGVSKCVVEIQETGSEYFERAVFFVKPEYFDTDEKKLRSKAQSFTADAAGVPPKNAARRGKRRLNPMVAAALGAAVGAILTGITAWIM